VCYLSFTKALEVDDTSVRAYALVE
jgi:hypothetical protein